MSNIGVVIPSIQRDSLQATFLSCAGANHVEIVDDSVSLRGACGHPARNEGIDRTTTEYVCSIDDDDVYVPGAFNLIRAAIRDNPGAGWFIFRMVGGPGSHFNGVTVPVLGHVLRLGNVGTPMMVWRNCAARFGMRSTDEQGRDFGAGYFGDWEMAKALQAEYGDPVWINETICVVRPQAKAESLV